MYYHESMHITINQIHTQVGGFARNVNTIIDWSKRAEQRGAELALFPELAVCGYLHLDLAFRNDFLLANQRGLERLLRDLPPNLWVVVGHIAEHAVDSRAPRENGERRKRISNCLTVIHDGAVCFQQSKRLLPNHDIFDEKRYFYADTASDICTINGARVGLAVCEDIWSGQDTPFDHGGTAHSSDVLGDLASAGAELIIAASASPYERGKPARRINLLQDFAKRRSLPCCYINGVHSEDGIIFDGNSFIINKQGQCAGACAPFAEEQYLFEYTGAPGDVTPGSSIFSSDAVPAEITTQGSAAETATAGRAGARQSDNELERALCFGLREFVTKSGFTRAALGLSGGIDSAVVAVLAARALGSDNVHALIMPSVFTSEASMRDATALAHNLNIAYTILPITAVTDAVTNTLQALPVNDGADASSAADVAGENIQARTRGLLLMAYANTFHALALATGNRSELATGYCTLYGDMCGALAPIGDLYKTELYELAKNINAHREYIPAEILTKAPSAELRPDQRDEDSLPPYPVLDAILAGYLDMHQSVEELKERGFSADVISQVIGLVAGSEYKRRQAAPVIRVHASAFGSGRRVIQCRNSYEESLE